VVLAVYHPPLTHFGHQPAVEILKKKTKKIKDMGLVQEKIF
jgi:hypothetical protein